MSFIAFLRPPLVWLVTAEAMLVAILGAVAWHVWQERSPAGPASAIAIPHAAAPAPRGSSPPGAGAQPQPSASSPPTATPRAGPTPGIRTDADFLSRQLSELNRVEATFEDLEWRATRAIVDAIQRYVDGVVLPSIERSEQGRG
jgi:hypothetical protein